MTKVGQEMKKMKTLNVSDAKLWGIHLSISKCELVNRTYPSSNKRNDHMSRIITPNPRLHPAATDSDPDLRLTLNGAAMSDGIE